MILRDLPSSAKPMLPSKISLRVRYKDFVPENPRVSWDFNAGCVMWDLEGDILEFEVQQSAPSCAPNGRTGELGLAEFTYSTGPEKGVRITFCRIVGFVIDRQNGVNLLDTLSGAQYAESWVGVSVYAWGGVRQTHGFLVIHLFVRT